MAEVKSTKCFGCEQELPASAFYKCASRKDGLQTQCKSCQNKRRRLNEAKNRERERIADRKQYARDPERHKATKTAWRLANLEKFREYTRKYNWKRSGLPTPTRPRPKHCECCGSTPKKVGLHLDHCHETGKFRGWLCGPCNTGIGQLGDSAAGLLRALRYLQST